MIRMGVINANNAEMAIASLFLGGNEDLGINGVASFLRGDGLICCFHLLKPFSRLSIPGVFCWPDFNNRFVGMGVNLSQD